MVVSSFMEGIPIVLMEAMSKQLAVVTTQVGGIPELVRNGIDGIYASPGSVESLANAIRPLAMQPSDATKFGESARERVIEDFSVAGLGRGMLKLLTDTLSPPAPAAIESHDRQTH